MSNISKIICGGLYGAESGAMHGAIKAEIWYAGMIPKGRRDVDRIVPLCYTEFQEGPQADFHYCLEWNIRHSDATLVLMPVVFSHGHRSTEIYGTALEAKRLCETLGIPFLIVFVYDLDQAKEWVQKLSEEIGRPLELNVTGPREDELPHFEFDAARFIYRLLTDPPKRFVPRTH